MSDTPDTPGNGQDNDKKKDRDRTAEEFPEYAEDYVPPPDRKPPKEDPLKPPEPIRDDTGYYSEKKKTGKKKKSGPKTQKLELILGILILVGAIVFYETDHLRLKHLPMLQETFKYKAEKHFYPQWPFVMDVYVMPPDRYDPRRQYPLVVVLPGAGNVAHAGVFLATPAMQANFPAFVVAPFISHRARWGIPDEEVLHIKTGPLPVAFDALPHLVGVVGDMVRRYPIDLQRIYITGHSSGGVGAYGALARYPSVFAGAVVSAGGWDIEDAGEIAKVPVWAIHGTADPKFPAKLDELLIAAVRQQGGAARYNALPRRGHNIWKSVYSNAQVWKWLFKQKKAPQQDAQ